MQTRSKLIEDVEGWEPLCIRENVKVFILVFCVNSRISWLPVSLASLSAIHRCALGTGQVEKGGVSLPAAGPDIVEVVTQSRFGLETLYQRVTCL